MLLAVAWLSAAAVLAGCATPPPPPAGPRTHVVLLPDADGHVGEVVVSNAAGTQTIASAYGSVTAAAPTAAPAAPTARPQADVEGRYAPLLRQEPTHPVGYTLFFVLDSTELTAESRALLPQVLDVARSRVPTRITVFGHADASGSERRNLQLSEARARSVLVALRKAHPELTDVEIQWFGHRVPLPGSEPRDPRNRRAEIVIL